MADFDKCKFTPPTHWPHLTTIDAHTGGEPLRVITSGWPEIPGDTILAKRRYAREHHDHLRKALMLEPRGHADMYGCILTEPVTEDGDVGVLFMHNEGYSTMCGHGIIGLVKVGIEAGLLPDHGPDNPIVRIDTPAGRVTATAHFNEDGGISNVSFLNVASFLLERDLIVQVEGLGEVTCDIGYGGAFYAYLWADQIGVQVVPEQHGVLIDIAMRIKRAVMEQYEIVHPGDGAGAGAGEDEHDNADLNFLYGTIICEPAPSPLHSRNICVFANGEVDRSPTGTGVSGRVAIHHSRGEIEVGESITIASLIGTTFDVRIVEETKVGDVPAVIPEVTGRAHITGRHEFFIDPDDSLCDGVLLR